YARFRFSTSDGLSYDGLALDGEVEDLPLQILPAVDLAFTQVDTSDQVNVTSNFAYVVTVTNRGPSTATLVALTNVLPANITFISATSSQGNCGLNAGRVTCAIGTSARKRGAINQIALW